MIIKKLTSFFNPEEYFLIFLDDYADRRNKSVEVILFVNDLIGLKENHESYSERGEPDFYPCTLKNEDSDWEKYFRNELEPFINILYLCAIINNILFVHAGVSSKIRSINDLKNPGKNINNILWSNPFKGDGEKHNSRGRSVLFGKDVSEKICGLLSLEMIIRSHELRKASNGIFYEHDERIVTISSTSVYGGMPFILEIKKNMKEIFL